MRGAEDFFLLQNLGQCQRISFCRCFRKRLRVLYRIADFWIFHFLGNSCVRRISLSRPCRV